MYRKATHKTVDRKKQILELLAQGLKQSDIARRLGVSRQFVHQQIDLIESQGFGRVNEALPKAEKTTATAGQEP